MGFNQSDTFIVLKPKDEWEVDTKEEIQEKIKNALVDFKGISFGFTQPIEMRTSEMLTGARGDVAIKIFGSDIDRLNELSSQIADLLGKIESSSEVFATINEGFTYLQITPNKISLANLGISIAEFQKFLQSSLDGIMVTDVPNGFIITTIIIRMDKNIQNNIDKFKNLELVTKNGKSVPISTIADIKQVEGPVQVNRETHIV